MNPVDAASHIGLKARSSSTSISIGAAAVQSLRDEIGRLVHGLGALRR